MIDNESTINDLLASLSDSIEDIHQHPTQIDRIPSNFEIILKGVSDSSAIDMLFSPQMDSLINKLFGFIENGNFEKIMKNEELITNLMDTVFGKGSFRGPVSQTVLNSIRNTTQSGKYIMMKSNLGKTIKTLKKVNLIIKNLEKDKNNFDKHTEEYKKYKEALYAIKRVLKFAARVYYNRKLINKKVWKGLNNIVHENYEEDLSLI